jgi:hypothetical protein
MEAAQETVQSDITLAKTSERKSAIYLLPSSTQQVIIQTAPSLAISCVLPPAKHQVRVDYYKDGTHGIDAEIEAPLLIWMQLFVHWKQHHILDSDYYTSCQCIRCNFDDYLTGKWRDYQGAKNPYRFFTYTANLETCREGYLRASDYSVANIDDGYVCWGKNIYPASLRQANTIYWGSILNNSPDKYYIDTYGLSYKQVNEKLIECMHSYKASRFGNQFDFFFGKKFLASSQGAVGVFVSFDKTLVEDNSEEAVSNGRTCSEGYEEPIRAIVGLAKRLPGRNIWSVDLKNSQIHLSDDQVRVR